MTGAIARVADLRLDLRDGPEGLGSSGGQGAEPRQPPGDVEGDRVVAPDVGVDQPFEGRLRPFGREGHLANPVVRQVAGPRAGRQGRAGG